MVAFPKEPATRGSLKCVQTARPLLPVHQGSSSFISHDKRHTGLRPVTHWFTLLSSWWTFNGLFEMPVASDGLRHTARVPVAHNNVCAQQVETCSEGRKCLLNKLCQLLVEDR